MSVVDQRVWVSVGRVRRLSVRVLLVLGGAFAVTMVGWLLCAGSANADVLPPLPVVPRAPAVLSAVLPVSPVSISDLKAPVVPTSQSGPGPVATDRRAPTPPAGSSDSGAHGGSAACGPVGAQVPLDHVLGHALNLACTPNTPRLAVAPGHQPGTSPD